MTEQDAIREAGRIVQREQERRIEQNWHSDRKWTLILSTIGITMLTMGAILKPLVSSVATGLIVCSVFPLIFAGLCYQGWSEVTPRIKDQERRRKELRRLGGR